MAPLFVEKNVENSKFYKNYMLSTNEAHQISD